MQLPTNGLRHDETLKLALAYMQSQVKETLNPEEYAKKFLEVSRAISDVIDAASALP